MPRKRSSVLTTQEPVLHLQAELAQGKLRIAEMEKQLVKYIAAHREQIKQSLKSRIPEERKMAEAIAKWWEVTSEE